MTPAEPIGPIHMPSPSILPFFMGLGFFIAGFGFMYAQDWGMVGPINTGYIIAGAGLLIVFACMFLRSVYDDHGFHIEEEEILRDKGGKA
jgi:cytochrome c oxidase subunit 1